MLPEDYATVKARAEAYRQPLSAFARNAICGIPMVCHLLSRHDEMEIIDAALIARAKTSILTRLVAIMPHRPKWIYHAPRLFPANRSARLTVRKCV